MRLKEDAIQRLITWLGAGMGMVLLLVAERQAVSPKNRGLPC